MMWLGEGGNTLIWAGEIVEETVHTKEEGGRRLTLDELKEIAEYLRVYVKNARGGK